MSFAAWAFWFLPSAALGHELPWHHGPTEPQKVFLTDLGGSGHMHFCFDEPIQQTGCTTTETSSTTASTETMSGSSTTVTSRTDSTESTSTSTDTTCFKYPDCYLTCDELVAPENGFDPCIDTFCSTCPFAHMCDMSCGVCSYNTTESETSSASTTSGTTSSLTTKSDTTVSQTTTSPTTISATTFSETSSTTASTFSECYQENVGNSMFGANFCESACGGISPGDCDLNSCETVFCPNCGSTFAGLCDLECGYCTTLTVTSTRSGTSETSTFTSGSSVTSTRTTTSTATTTTESSTSVTTATSTSKSTRTATTRSATSTSETSMTSTGSTSATSTTCFKYSDCIDSCESLVGLDPEKCETMFCATCEAAHVCDFTCGICAENTTGSATSSSTRTSDTASTTSVSTETMSTTSLSTTSISTTTESSTFTESTISTFSECVMINIKSDDFCNLTCAGQQCQLDACDTLFCPDCPGQHAGMCDQTCGYCTTLTITSSATHTSVTSTRTTSTTETTTTESSTSTSTDTTTTTMVSSSITETLSTYTRTSKSTYTTPTQTSTLTATESGTTTTCFKLADCLENDICTIMTRDCERTFCPTCPAAHLCDTTCGFCYVNSTTTETTTITTESPTTATASTATGVTATTQSGTSTTSATTTSRTASTLTDTTETACNQTNLATDTFCENTCGSEVCPVNICRTLFCLSCDLAGFCDRTCNFCSAKMTSTETSTTSVSSATLTTSSVSSTATCKPCIIDFPIPHTGCDGLIPCGETCIANTLATPCLEPMTFNFECADPDDFEKGEAFSLGPDWANGSFIRAHGARSGENHLMCPEEFPSCQTSGIMKGQCVTEECSQNRDLPFRACLDQEPGWPSAGDDSGGGGPSDYVPNGAFWQENGNFINTRTALGDGPGSVCTSDFEFFRAARLIDTLGDFTVNCQSCAFGTHELTDTDPRGNHINVTLEFGPNVLDGVVNEGILSGYAVYLVSACTVPTKYKEGWTHYIKVADVPVDPSDVSETAAECRCGEGRNKYSVTVAREIDHFNGEMTYYYDDVSLSLRFDYFDSYIGQYFEQNESYVYYFLYYSSYASLYDDQDLEWRLMVVPVLLDGTEMPVGLTTETIRDVSEASHTIELDWCFSIPVDQAVCASTSSVTTSSATSTESTESATTSSATTGTETSTGTTQTTCFMYEDCYQTCALMIAADPGVCEWQFCEICSHAHFCDMSCGICASNTTTSDTSTGTSSSDTSSTTFTSSTTVSTSSETSSSTRSTGTTSGTSSTTLSTETVCYMEDLMNSSICRESCDGVHCQVDVCNTLYCPNCPGPYAGMCDKTCRFCTTVTVSSSTTESTDTSTQTTKSRTTTTTVSTTTGTSTVSTFSSTTETSTFTTTASTTSETTYSSTGSSSTTASTDSETSTGCFLYEDCLDTCEQMVAGLVTVSGFLSGSSFACRNGLCTCDTIFCPTCSGAHLCDTTCGWCAYNTTTSESSTTSASTTSGTSMSTTSMSTTSGTQSTDTTTGTSMSVSTSTTSTLTVTPCASINILSEEFCNATCILGDRCANDGCATLFCPNCAGAYAGMCDRTCGFCTTLTNTSTTSLTSSTITRTTSTTETTVTDTATSDTTETTTITTWSGSTTDTVSSATSVTTDTGSSTTATSSTTLSTETETSVCYMFDDCLTTCEEMRDNCAITFCPTCPGAHLCDTTCSICAFNVTHPCLCTTSTDSSSTTASTGTDTTSSATTASDTSVSTTSGSSTTTMSTTSQTSSTTFTPCNPTNFANDTFCDLSCEGTDCPRDVCESLFCPTCHFAGHCDRSCNFCTAKHTTSWTSTTTATSVSTVSETTDSTYTCEPCHVNFEVPGLGVAASDCNGPLACDSTCFVVLGFHESDCFSGMELEFTCPPGNDFEIPYTIDHIKIPLREREGLPINRRLGERQHLDERVQDRRLQLLNPEPRTWGNGTVIRIEQHVEHIGGRSPWIDFLGGNGLIDVEHFNIYCASCGFGANGLANDTDINCGELSTTLLFGPNVFDGMVNESMLSGYAVFIVEDCQESLLEHTHIDNAIAVVLATGVGSGTMTGEQCACSMKEQYSVPLNISFVGQYTNLMVVPVLNDGTVVPVGPTIKVEDLCISTTTETSTTTDTQVELSSGVLALSALSPGADLVGMLSQIQVLLADLQGVTEQDVGVVISNSQDFVELASSQAGGGGAAENLSVYICIEVTAQSHTQHLRPVNDNQLLSLWIQMLRDTYGDATVATTLHTSKVDRATYSSLSQCGKELQFIEQARTSTSTTSLSETTVTGTVTSLSTTATSATSKTTTSNTGTSATSTQTSATTTSTTTISKTSASRTVTSMTTTSMTTASRTVMSETTTSRTVTSLTTTSRTDTSGTSGTRTTRSTSITTTSPHTATTRTTITDIYASRTVTSTTTGTTDTTFTSVTTISTTASSATASSTTASITVSSSTTVTSTTDTPISATSNSATSTSATSVSATSVSPTSTSVTGTVTSVTTVSRTAMSSVTGNVVVSLEGASEDLVIASAKTAVAAIYDVSESVVRVTIAGGRRLSGRSLQSAWNLDYEILANAQALAAKLETFDSDVAAASFATTFTNAMASSLGISASEVTQVTVSGFSTPVTEAVVDENEAEDDAEEDESDGMTSAGQPAASNTKASSSTVVLILGIALFMVLFLGLLIPCLCKRRMRNLCCRKGNVVHNNVTPKAQPDSSQIDGSQKEKKPLDWDVDCKRAPAETVDRGDSQAALEAIAALGLTVEESRQMGLVKGITV